MSDSPVGDTGEVQRTVQIPSLLTNSFRAMLETFDTDIIQIRARGSIETTNTTIPDSLRDYAVSWEQSDRQSMRVDYEQLPGSDGPANPLSESARQQLFEEMEVRLDPQEPEVSADLAVRQMTLRVTDERLQQVTPAQSPEFDLVFVSDPAEPPVREVTQRQNLHRRLYDVLGFECRNLNLRSVIETETKYHQQSDGKYFSWGGPSDIRPRSPERLAIRINEHLLPAELGTLKPYRVTDDSTLELVDEEFEQTQAGVTSQPEGDA